MKAFQGASASDWVQDLAKRIKSARIFIGMSQKELANRCGLHQSAICQIESGGNSPSIESLFNICLALKIHPGSLFAVDFYVETLQVAP